MSGTLYLCPTPIGNLEDITFRTIRILKEVDLIVAEDTRQTIKLLNHYKINKPLISYHEHNKISSGEKIIKNLKSEKNIALVTDAGTPAISDPGYDLVKRCIEENIAVVPLPGATAITTALIASGLDTREFVFIGFLPIKKKDRDRLLYEIFHEKRTVIIYEAPHRILETLKEFKHYDEKRNIVVARELTKVHEEFIRGKIDDVLNSIKSKAKGEMVVLIEGYKEVINKKPEELAREYMDNGLNKKEAIKLTAKKLGIPKSEVYKIMIDDK